MQNARADFTNTFRQLAETGSLPASLESDESLRAWRLRWVQRLAGENQTPESAAARMQAVNPAVIPRNHRVEESLAAAEKDDLALLHGLLAAVTKPFDGGSASSKYRELPPANRPRYRTFCGT
jgi:uncharacterized protein YdiU (UPF0061 family)